MSVRGGSSELGTAFYYAYKDMLNGSYYTFVHTFICGIVCVRHITRDHEATDNGRVTLTKDKDIYKINF